MPSKSQKQLRKYKAARNTFIGQTNKSSKDNWISWGTVKAGIDFSAVSQNTPYAVKAKVGKTYPARVYNIDSETNKKAKKYVKVKETKVGEPFSGAYDSKGRRTY